MPEPVLHLDSVTYRYPGAGADALLDFSLTVHPGEFVVLAGRSGSGKTTLLRAACGLVPHFHGGTVDGEVRVGGADVRENGPAELASLVGLVAQDPESQVLSTTVRAEIELPLELRGVAAAVRARAVEEVALALGVDQLLDRTTDTLSGGELQRVALAAALAPRPALLLLDEPTSQLDPVAGDELISVLRRLNEELAITVILGEHRLERCLSAADRVVALDAGALAFDGAPAGFLRWAIEADFALVTPAARLLHAVGVEPRVSVRDARRALGEAGYDLVSLTSGPGDGGDAGGGAAGNEPAAGGGVGASLAPGAGTGHASGGTAPGRIRAAARRTIGRSVSAEPQPALELRALDVELGEGKLRRTVLRGAELLISPGERVALMGRNGVGKSTLLHAAAGLIEPIAGQVRTPLGVALLPQRPDDLILRDRVGDELPGADGAAALRAVGLDRHQDADPRDLSGGERQRLAMAIAFAGRGVGVGKPPGLVLMDEPTRGMDRARKEDLAGLIGQIADSGAAVVVATHDVEFAAVFAERVVLLGAGVVAADGSVGEMLAGGWYFSTEVARVLCAAAVTAEQGVALLSGSKEGASTRSLRASTAEASG